MFPCPGSTTTTTCRVLPDHLITCNMALELPLPPPELRPLSLAGKTRRGDAADALPRASTRTGATPRGSGAGAGRSASATVAVGEGVPGGGSICQRDENCGTVPLQSSVQMQGSWRMRTRDGHFPHGQVPAALSGALLQGVLPLRRHAADAPATRSEVDREGQGTEAPDGPAGGCQEGGG